MEADMSDWGLDSEMVDCMSCGTVSSLDEVAALGGRCPVCGKYDTETDVGKHYGAADEGSRGWHHTASTDGIRYAHLVEADVADDLMRMRLAGRPKRIKPPWSDFHNGQAYPLQNQNTADLVHMFYSLRDAHRAGEPPADGVTPFSDRIPHYEAELLDRHEAGDPEATRWADRGSYIKPDYMNDAEWQTSRRMYPEDYPVDPRPARRRKPTAAVNQDLVDRLHDEFHQWWENKQNLDTDPASADYWKGNGVSKPIQYWPHIEEFLSHKYPASNRWHDMGMEEAGHILDGHKPMPYQVQSGADTTPYETGPEAIATYGYDPKEIAAGMLLLHNRSNPLRGDMLPQDQARLNDIFQKRQQMQRDYEQRTKTAMPRQDAYDAGTLKNNFGGKPDQTPPFPGPWFHGSPDKLEVGDILHPGASKNYEYEGDRAPRQNWVFMDLDARRAQMWAGEAARQRQMPHDAPAYVYHVEPLDEGPWPWNEYPDMGYASPRARVVERRHVDEMGDWDQQPQFGPRRKRDISKLMERLRANQPKTARNARLAAVNQDAAAFLRMAGFDPREVTNRLDGEFRDWAAQNAHRLHDTAPYGPLRDWRNIENFLGDRYPAAGKGFNKGMEGAQQMLDRKKPRNVYGDTPEEDRVITPYETGPEAVAKYGYDPAEIAAGVLLLHNNSHPFRMEWANDKARLVDIFQKRQQMQRAYEQRQTTASRTAMPWSQYEQSRNARLAMPAIDAYDNYDSEEEGIEVPRSERVDHQAVRPGPYFHSTWNDFPPGHILLPRRDLGLDENPMAPNHNNWVWMSEHPADANYHTGYGAHVYEVEPLDEGPWKWNKHPDWDDTEDGGNRYVSPRARIIRKIEPDENGEYFNWTPPHTARLAGKNGDLPEGLTFRHHPDGFDPFPAFDPDDPVPPPGHKWVQFQEDLDYDEDEDDDSVPFYLAAPDGDSWHVRGADNGFRYSDDELKIHNRLPPGVRPEMGIDSWPTVSAHDGDRTAGYLQWISNGTNHGEIRNMQVHPDYRRRGIGLALFDQASKVEPRLHHSENLTEDGRGWSAYEQSRHARLASSEWPDPSRETIPADPQYVYHGTHDYNAQDIADFGHLDVHDPDYGTDQDTWPDGSVEPRSYWTHDPQVARNFYPEGGRPTLLRSPRSSGDFRQERHSGDLYSTSPISADHLEVYSGPGQWTPLTQHRERRTAGKNGPPPPMTFEPFNTMWTNGIMARHAEDGRPLAHLHWYPDGEIETIRVHPQMRGRDIGKAILTHAASHPDTYEASDGIKPSNTLTPDGRAFARSMGHNPTDEEVTPAEGEDQWAWKAVNKYVPMNIPYNGQNEDEMSRYLDQPWTPPAKTASVDDEGWPVWWRGRHRMAGPFDKRWHPNHPEHTPAPWDS